MSAKQPDFSRTDWATEKALVNAVLAELRAHGAWAEKIHGHPFQRAGLPDITGVFHGMRFDLEGKIGAAKPTALQNACIEELKAHGSEVRVIYCVQDALDALDAITNKLRMKNLNDV